MRMCYVVQHLFAFRFRPCHFLLFEHKIIDYTQYRAWVMLCYVMIKFNVVELIKDANFIVQHSNRTHTTYKQYNTAHSVIRCSAANTTQHGMNMNMYVGNKVWYFDFNVWTSGERRRKRHKYRPPHDEAFAWKMPNNFGTYFNVKPNNFANICICIEFRAFQSISLDLSCSQPLSCNVFPFFF